MSLEKMDALFGITDDLLRIMDENQRQRAAASRTAAEGLDTLVPGSVYTATTVAETAGEYDKRHTGSSGSKEEPIYRL